jgi:predicted RNase H-like HicB family nuclease
MMKKILAIVRRTEDGFRGYVPKLPGCEIRAATAEQAEADLTAAARAHVAAGKEGTNGFAADEVEFAVVVEPIPPERIYANETDEAIHRWGYELPDDETLEAMLNPDEHKWLTFEEVMSELGLDPEDSSVDGSSE